MSNSYVIVQDDPETVYVFTEKSNVVITEEREVVVLTVAEQGPPGPAGASGAGGIEHPFAFGDATPAPVVTAPAGKLVYGVQVHISEAFNGTNPQIIVGDAGDNDRLMSAGQNDPTAMAGYTSSPEHRYSVPTVINITIIPGDGATAGRGLLTLFIEQ